jgi:hypothetical protein
MALRITMLCHSADCRVLFIVMLSMFLMNIFMMGIVLLSVIMLSVIMLSVIMLSVILLSVILLSVIILSVVAPCLIFMGTAYCPLKRLLLFASDKYSSLLSTSVKLLLITMATHLKALGF